MQERIKLFSVTMTEEELSLFSEFLEQREYARKDYEGLTREGKKALRKRRSDYSKFLRQQYKDAKQYINSDPIGLLPGEKITSLSTEGNFGTKYSLSNRYHVNTPVNPTSSMKENVNNHISNVREEILNASKKGAKELREGIELEFGTKKTKGTGKPKFSSRGDVYRGDISRLDGISRVNTQRITADGYFGRSNNFSLEGGIIDHHSFRNAPLSGKGSSFKKRIPNKIKKAGKTAAAIAIPVAAIGTGVAVYKKYNKKNKGKKKEENN